MSNQLFKADAGKLRPSLFFEGLPRSIQMGVAVLSYGGQKYEAHSWKKVAVERYHDAKLRHMIADTLYGGCDEESGLLHKAHEMINGMFILEQELEGYSQEEFEHLLKFNPPPQSHKEVK